MKHFYLLLATAFAVSFVQVSFGQSESDSLSQGIKAYESGEYEKAIEFLTKAALGSNNPAIYGNRGNCYSYLSNLDAALKDYDTAIRLANDITKNPNDKRLAYLYYNRAYAYQRGKKYKEAIADYEKTISLDDDYPDVKNSLAWMLATCPEEALRDPRRAIDIATTECRRLEFKDHSALDTLAAAFAANGSFAEAADHQQKAVDLADNDELKAEYQQRLELYRNHKAYVQPPTPQ